MPFLPLVMILYVLLITPLRTWPYNTVMLRTLFFSVLVPLATVLIRIAAEVIYR